MRRDVRVPALLVLLAACGAPPPNGTAIGARPIANARSAPGPLPAACLPEPAEAGYAPWDRRSGIDCIGVARAPDEGWVVLMFHRLEAYDRDGRLRWREVFDDAGHRCGAPDGVAVDTTGRIVVACGYSLLGYAADGTFRWQVWPGGNNTVGPPLVGADGTAYVGSEGALYAVAIDGTTTWQASTGFNKWFDAIAPTPSGQLMVHAKMAALHSEDDGSGYRFYYEHEPAEVVVIDLAGKIVSRTEHEGGSDAPWPEWIDVVGEGGGRVP
jgi:hypothetical protein